MLKPPDTVSIEFVRGMLSGVGYPSKSCADYLAAASIDPALIEQPSSRITSDQYVALFGLLMERLNDEFLGFLSRPLRRGGFEFILRSILGASTLGHAMHRMGKALYLLQDDFEFVYPIEGDIAGLRIVFKSSAGDRVFLHEMTIRAFWRLIVWLHGERLRTVRFDFAFPTPTHASEYKRVFPGPLRFDQPHTTFWFEAKSLDAPMLRDEKAMREFLALAPGFIIIPKVSEHSVTARVRAYLHSRRPEWPNLAATADALNMSSSTLQRHLAEEGATFQSVKNQLRLDAAIVRLDSGGISLAALALELGFADSASFQRAFKLWTGSPPGAYRRFGPASESAESAEPADPPAAALPP